MKNEEKKTIRYPVTMRSQNIQMYIQISTPPTPTESTTIPPPPPHNTRFVIHVDQATVRKSSDCHNSHLQCHQGLGWCRRFR